ncbi:MAG: DUF2730 family protein [Deltaproteobacteria bacterium]|jgi:phage-related tail protein|nr:DUF2730 family protein [Deltaproteobacteria bacterium]
MNDFLDSAGAAYPIIGAFLNLLLGLGLLWLRAHFTPRAESEALNRRVEQVEKNLAALATAGDIKEINRSLTSMTVKIEVLQEAMSGQKELFERLEAKVDRLDAFLMERGA